eukprot:scaffold521054_cov20-Prasinocladus_malaysianus.AAC.1
MEQAGGHWNNHSQELDNDYTKLDAADPNTLITGLNLRIIIGRGQCKMNLVSATNDIVTAIGEAAYCPDLK